MNFTSTRLQIVSGSSTVISQMSRIDHSAGSEETWLYCIAIRPGYNSVQRGDTGYRFLFSLGGVEETPG